MEPMNLHMSVGWLVVWSVGRSVIISYKGSDIISLLLEHLFERDRLMKN